MTPLFERLWERGVVVVSTSNRAPEDLYTGGLNRHMHLPSFLRALHANSSVVELQGRDHRRTRDGRSGFREGEMHVRDMT